MEKVRIWEDLLKRLITNLWYQDPGIEGVVELSKELIDDYPEYFVDISESEPDGIYIGTRPEWMSEDRNANLIYAPKDEEEEE